MLWYIKQNPLKLDLSLVYILKISATDPNKEASTNLDKFNFMESSFLGAQFCLHIQSGRWIKPKSASHQERNKKYCFLFFIKDFFNKCDQIRRKLRIWSHLLKKSLTENFIFCAVRRYFKNFYKSVPSPSTIQHCPKDVFRNLPNI